MGRKTDVQDRMLLPFLRLGDGVIDVGANIGNYTERFARAVGPTGHVIGIEPDEDNLRKAIARCADMPQVEFVHAACAGANGSRVLYLGVERRSHNSFWQRNIPGGKANKSRPCELVTLDEVAATARGLRAIKVDTQGAELLVLKGAAATLARFDGVWQIELWPFGLESAGTTLKTVVQRFQATGWQPHQTNWLEVVRRAKTIRAHTSFDVVVTR